MSGALRLPKDIDASERRDRVDDLLNDLGLSAVADSLVRRSCLMAILACLLDIP